MTINLLKDLLLWSLLINYGLLLLWVGLFTFAHGWLFGLHGRWFRLSEEAFNMVHYAAMAFFKLAIIVLNLTPLVALWIAT